MSLILCADDFAQNREISQGILALASQHRLSAISCMTQMPLWPTLAPELTALKIDLHRDNKTLQLGIHFNLTHLSQVPHQDKSICPLSYWLMASALGKIDRKAIQETFTQQCDAFENAVGQIPDFIDGHQHVHAFPVIREVIIKVILKRYAHKLPHVRNLNLIAIKGQGCSFKSFVLQKMTQGLSTLLTQHAIPYNRYFSGLYNLKPNSDYQALIDQWFKNAPDNTLIMCHPGLASLDKTDPIAATRLKEFEVLKSDWFYQEHLSRLWT